MPAAFFYEAVSEWLPYLNLCGLTRFSMPSRKVDQAFVRKGAARFFVSARPQTGQVGARSPTFMIRSKEWPQAPHSYSYIGMGPPADPQMLPPLSTTESPCDRS